MVTIKIDEETFDYLKANALVYIDKTPGDTIKRLLRLTDEKSVHRAQILGKDSSEIKIKRDKAPKTNLLCLIEEGVLQNGEVLFFQDSRGKIRYDVKVHVSNNSLIYENRAYSMSQLALKFLKREGYNTKAVRGTLFWVTENRKSISELWQNYLNK